MLKVTRKGRKKVKREKIRKVADFFLELFRGGISGTISLLKEKNPSV